MHRTATGIAALAVVLVMAGCGGGGERNTAGGEDHAFASLEEFNASDVSGVSRQVIFIGIDAAAWEFIDPLIETGQLPNLARIKAEGATATLRSIPCYVSPPAWASMLTGDLPAKTGVYTYGRWLPDRREFGTVDASDLKVPSVWEVASAAGREVGSFNVPMSYPPTPVSGAVVGGEMTPYEMHDPVHSTPVTPVPEWTPKTDFTDYAPVRRTATTDSLNTYLWSVHDTTDDDELDYDTVVLEVRPGGETVTFPLGHFSPWVRIRTMRDGKSTEGFTKVGVFEKEGGGYDTQLSPVFAPIDAPYTYPASLAQSLQERFGFYVPSVFLGRELVPSMTGDAASAASWFYDLQDWDLYMYVFTQSDNIHHFAGFSGDAAEVYDIIDRFVGEIMDRMPTGATLVIASDHGFRRYEWGIDLNRMFEEMGLLARTADGDIDFDHTLVFHNLWHLYFNHTIMTRDELARRGLRVPDDADPVAWFADWLTHFASDIRTADGRHQVAIHLHPFPHHTDADPDMSVDGASGNYIVDFVYQNHHPAVFYQLEGREQWWHQRDGVLMAWGDNVKPGYRAPVQDIQNVAPTLLYLLGAPVADDLDGHVMDDLFVRRDPHFTVPDYSGMPETPAAEKKSTESLEKKLRGLGYLQ